VSLGDSCTFFGSPPYTTRLERLLADRGTAAEVFNAGVPGYSSYQGLRWFESEIAGYDPDWVTVFYGWNDHWLAARTPDHLLAERRAPAAVEALVAWSRLAQAGIWLRARSSQPPPEGRPLRVPPERYRENLERLCASARGAGARVVMITAPSELDADDVARLRREGYAPPTGAPRELHEEYNALAREAAASCGATLLDFAREAEGGEGWLSEDGIHLTPGGMDRLAARLADVISGAGR
jgi:lysophospholipase L1-like esterase